MSAYIYGNCERCGQPFTVEENTHHVTFLVGGKVVQECPVCGEELSANPTLPSPKGEGEGNEEPPTFATTKDFLTAKGGEE